MSTEPTPDEAQALRLAQEIADLLDRRRVSPEVSLIALAKVTGHAATVLFAAEAENALASVYDRMQQQMLVTRLAARLQEAGLGALMRGTAS